MRASALVLLVLVGACGGRAGGGPTDAGTPETSPPPVEAAPACTGTVTPTGCLVTLATGQQPENLAIDATSVYWTNYGSGQFTPDGSVVSVPIAGGTPVTLASGRVFPVGIAVDANNVYWTEYGGNGKALGAVMSVPLAGGNATALVPGRSDPGSLAIDATNAYWTEPGVTDAILSIPLTGGTPATLTSNVVAPENLIISAGTLFWVDNGVPGEVETLALGGGTPKVLAAVQGATGLALGGGRIYWPDQNGAVTSVAVGGGAPTTITEERDAGTLAGIAADATNVYIGAGVFVQRVPVAGGAPTTIATGPGQVTRIALDATSVYWIDGSGAVMRLTPK